MSDEIDLEDLDAYLSSDDSPENCMMLSDIDGFLHGVVCSPMAIPSKHWVPVVIGGDPRVVPDWALTTIIEHYKAIAERLMSDPQVVETIFWKMKDDHVVATDWCEGFMQAVALRPKEWLSLTESGTDGHLVAPIMVHLLDENGNSVVGIPHEELDQVLAEAADAIPDTVIDIFNYWKG